MLGTIVTKMVEVLEANFVHGKNSLKYTHAKDGSVKSANFYKNA